MPPFVGRSRPGRRRAGAPDPGRTQTRKRDRMLRQEDQRDRERRGQVGRLRATSRARLEVEAQPGRIEQRLGVLTLAVGGDLAPPAAPVVNDGPVERRDGLLPAHRPSPVRRTRRTESVFSGCLGRIGRAILAAMTGLEAPAVRERETNRGSIRYMQSSSTPSSATGPPPGETRPGEEPLAPPLRPPASPAERPDDGPEGPPPAPPPGESRPEDEPEAPRPRRVSPRVSDPRGRSGS